MPSIASNQNVIIDGSGDCPKAHRERVGAENDTSSVCLAKYEVNAA